MAVQVPGDGGCAYQGSNHHKRPQDSDIGPLTWGSNLGAHSMAWRAVAAPPSSGDEQRGQSQLEVLLSCLAALYHPDVVGVQSDVGTTA